MSNIHRHPTSPEFIAYCHMKVLKTSGLIPKFRGQKIGLARHILRPSKHQKQATRQTCSKYNWVHLMYVLQIQLNVLFAYTGGSGTRPDLIVLSFRGPGYETTVHGT